MKVPQVLAALLLLQTAAAIPFSESIYMLAVTSQPVGGTVETLLIQVYPYRNPLSLTLTLEYGKQSRILLKQNNIKQDFNQAVIFKVPQVNVELEASIRVQIYGAGQSVNNKTNILIKPRSQLTIIHTDKPIYKPGQTVKFRIVTLDPSFRTLLLTFPTIEIQDPNSNRIGQWLNQSTSSGILDLSYPVNSEAQQGSYLITAWNTRNEQISQAFEIREYVLPKFEVTVQLPPVITVLDSQATLNVCAKYTYGKPVKGSVTAVVCRKHYVFWWIPPETRNNTDICRTYSMTTDSTGCGSTVLNLMEYALTSMQYEDIISAECKVEEFGTGVVMKGSGSSTVTSNMVTLTFENAPEAFKVGMAYKGKIKVTGPDSVALKRESVSLTARYGDNKNVTWALVTDDNGYAPFSLNTLLWGSDSVSLEASHHKIKDQPEFNPDVRTPSYPTAYLWIQPFYSKSKSFLELLPSATAFSCDKNAVVEAQYIIQGEEIKPGQMILDFLYIVMSKGSVAQYGLLSVAVKRKTVNKGKVRFSLTKVNTLAPYAQVVVYTILPNGEAVADSMDFPVELCLLHKVSLTFTSLNELPGAQTSLVLKANPGSLCSVKAIDRSVLLLKPEKKLTVQSVFDLLPVQRLSGYPYSLEDPFPCLNDGPIGPVPLLEEGLVQPRSKFFLPPFIRTLDVYSVFKRIGMKILTNAEVKQPSVCRPPFFFFRPAVMKMDESASAAVGSAPSSEPAHTVRTFFPETWIWDLVPVGVYGVMGVKKTIPDSITTWSAGGFCISPAGLGVAPDVELTAFQPFFVSLTLPSSIVRGEVFKLKATVFNYQQSCISVKVTLAGSQQFSARECVGCQYTLCLCAEESSTFTWVIEPLVLGEVSFNVSAEALKTPQLCGDQQVTVPVNGRIDTVVQTLLVVAEGTKQTTTYNELLCVTGNTVEKSVSLKLPDVFVKGSATAAVSVLGDLMGRALRNLDSLLEMPFGCGEQNMLRFAPNIYIMQYLQSSYQLTPQIREKASTFLVSGYQRELTYKHPDGSYSAFGTSDASGNTWLTAFVMKSFASALQFIFVDRLYVDQAKTWLGQQQQKDGSFASVGQLFHSDMKGGVSDELTLTAYITAAMLELGTPTTDPVVTNSLTYLRLAWTQQSSIYATALVSYAFTLAGDQEMRNKTLSMLDKQAIVTASGRHWSRAADGTLLDSLEVEMTSYVLLALLSGPQLPVFDMGYSASIVYWLAQQQNAFGGFASTQDTVVALQALAKYSAATYRPAGTVELTVTSPSGQKLFTVRQSNRLLLQEVGLQEVPGDYTLRAKGAGCVFAQFTVRYNIPPPAEDSSFSISARTSGNCSASIPSVGVFITVRFNGKRSETNMVIIEIKLLSGFTFDQESLKPSSDVVQVNQGAVKRVDQKDGSVVIYLDGLKWGEYKTYSLVMLQETVVQNLKPAVIKVYDYYETLVAAVTDYTSPC